MGKKIKCKNHNITLTIPQNDIEHTSLVQQVTLLLEHLEEFPLCTFEEMRIEHVV
jgi:hypothetical protein